MYLPEAFRQHDSEAIFDLAAAYPFATLVTAGPAGVQVSHLPLLARREGPVLRGHLARENPQVADLAAGTQALAIFHGPHGYVSPSVYVEAKPSVPTWNYAVAHVRGTPRVVSQGELRAILDETVARFDRTGWRLDESPEFLSRMLGAIEGFEIAVHSMEGKWKLSQNRPIEDREAVAAWFEGGRQAAPDLARMMRALLVGNTSERQKP